MEKLTKKNSQLQSTNKILNPLIEHYIDRQQPCDGKRTNPSQCCVMGLMWKKYSQFENLIAVDDNLGIVHRLT